MMKIFSVGLFLALMLPGQATPPQVGEKAPDFELASLDGKTVRLNDLNAKSNAIIVLLRGYPGYQCPLCNRQVRELIQGAESLTNAGANVLLIYPGPADRAKEFVADKAMPAQFHFLLDPDYKFTNLYGLRWDAQKETAYPSTFILDQSGIVRFAKISKTHGGRSTVSELVQALGKLSNPRE